MRAIYLIARREYLSYVATWGFWLSIGMVPVFMLIGALLPVLITSSQPTRYYAVIDETGSGYDDMVERALTEGKRAAVRGALEALAGAQGPEVRRAALEAFDADPDGLEGLPDALRVVGLEESADAFSAGLGRQVRVEAPALTPDGLRPYLTGERLIATPDGDRPLFAAMIIRDGAEAQRDPDRERSPPLLVDYYSTNLTSNELTAAASRALGDALQRQYLAERGLAPEDLAQIDELRPEVRDLNPEAAAGGEAEEVTLADRAPFVVALFLGLILWLSVFSIAQMLLTGLIEEKGGKIIELLLSTARFHEILIGKLAGVVMVSMTFFAVWGVLGGVAGAVFGSAASSFAPELAQLLGAVADPGLLIPALGYFLIGYLMYGTVYLAVGSLCETLQDAQSLIGPVILFLMVPVFIMFLSFEAQDSVAVRVASWVPFWTPFVMMGRLPTDPPAWELAATTAIMLVTSIVVIWAAAGVFRQGALNQADADSVKRFFRIGGRKRS
jgi:ABC-2 type transport system permease protein